MQDFTEREALLIELVHFLSYGSESEMGYSLQEIMAVLDSRIKRKDNAKVLELLEKEGHSFLAELKQHLKSRL